MKIFIRLTLFLAIIISFQACKKKASQSDISIEDTSKRIGKFSQKLIDSTRIAEDKRPIFLNKLSPKVDSVTSVSLMLPLCNYIKEYTFSSFDIAFEDPNTESQKEFSRYYILNTFSNSQSDEYISFFKSKDPNLFTIETFKKYNDIGAILYEDANTIAYMTRFDDVSVYHRDYDEDKGVYYLYNNQLPKLADKKAMLTELFYSINKGKNVRSFDKQVPENVTWEVIKPSIDPLIVKQYEVYYNSLAKEIKYFMVNDEAQKISTDNLELILYRDKDHSDNKFDQVTAIANAKYNGTYENLGFANKLSENMDRTIHSDDNLTYIRNISDHTILVKTYDYNGFYSTKEKPDYYTISSITDENGQFYLISKTYEKAIDIDVLINDYFSKHLKL